MTVATPQAETPGTPAVRSERVVRGQWLLTAQAVRDAGASLLAVWGSDERDRGENFMIRAAFQAPGHLTVVELPVTEHTASFPSLSSIYPSAERMERAVHDLLGISAEGCDARPWLRHAAWRENQFPLRHDFQPAPSRLAEPENYPFVSVEGDGVHEIAVGPVHAGIIEPGHFRFSVVGEKLLRLEERLGYAHKGIEKRFEAMSLSEGQRLAARVSGDSTVAFSWAYCMAAEDLCQTALPSRAAWLRALLLERERIANHLGDLGALGNDAGFAFALSQFSRLKENFLRVNSEVFGARYPMDAVIPGGCSRDLTDKQRQSLLSLLPALETDVSRLRNIIDEHAGVQDRFIGAGRVNPSLAVRLGLTGFAARASGQARDLRCDLPCVPFGQLKVRTSVHQGGDVAARVAVRFDELLESLRLARLILEQLPSGPVHESLAPATVDRFGIGLVEGWRGPVFVALEAGSDGRIRRCHAHDPSWHNWPVLEHAVIDNIVPDFPLINKSFNLSYSGHDL